MDYTSREVYKFVSQQTHDPIVERKVCAVSGQEFPIYQSDLDSYDKISPVFNGIKYPIPTPTLCPEERERRRMSRRNEWSLYRSTCNASGKKIISMYPDNSGYTIYDWKIWYTDQRDAMDYGRDFDFSKTFFENFELLNRVVPKKSLHIVDSMENCEYCNYGIFSKSCYLVNGGGRAENCLYSIIPVRSTYDVDGGFNTLCQNCYQCIHSISCFACRYTDHSNNCKNSSFLSFCNNCEDCIGCVNLQFAKYCILNKQYTKEEYEIRAKDILKDRNTILDFQGKFELLVASSLKKNLNNISAESSFANYIQNGKGHIFCSVVFEGTGNKYCSYTGMNKEDPIYDGYATTQSGHTIETCGFTGRKSAFVLTGEFNITDCYYCQHISACEYCFGCVGVKNKKYCILNKQYTKEAYEVLVPKIIEHMQKNSERGEFFPGSVSPFGYNETIAYEFFPISKENALKLGYKRQDQEYPINIPENAQTIKAHDLPKNIEDVTDDILNKVIICELTGKPFRIIKPELEFYRKHHLPLPHKHPDQRHVERMALRNPRKLRERKCAKCSVAIQTSYAPERPEIVYCESCYDKEIFG